LSKNSLIAPFIQSSRGGGKTETAGKEKYRPLFRAVPEILLKR